MLAYGTTPYTDANNVTALAATGDNVKFGAGFTNTNIAGLAPGYTSFATRTMGSIDLGVAGTTINASGAGAGTTINLTSANLLSTGAGSNTIGGGLVIAMAGTEGGLFVDSGNTLNVNGVFTGAANVDKALGGNLVFNTRQYFNTGANYFTIDGGTVKLNGGNNTLWAGVQGGANSANLAVSPGAVLDLNGTIQVVGNINSPNSNAFINSGGTITSVSGAASTLVNASGATGTWGGQITGNVYFARTGVSNFSAYSDNPFTGGLLLNGGITTLVDGGRFSGVNAVDLNYANLTLANTGTLDLPNRLSSTVALNLRGGAFIYNGRAATASAESVGTVTLFQGGSDIAVNAGGTGLNSAELTIANLVRTGSNNGTVTFNIQVGSNIRSHRKHPEGLRHEYQRRRAGSHE